ncbi:MAG TPA: hypothetical protein VNQ90_20685 [Chthoniobacteraceae bacterium]|nr:hypothetical protein [Chthoniobacteraceae bacterium]
MLLSLLHDFFFSEGYLANTVFRVIAVAGFLMAMLQVILRLVGVDDDGIAEGGDHGGGQVISWTTLSGFTLAFGAVGSLMLGAGYSIVVATLCGALAGLALGAIFLFLMRMFSLLKEDNTFQIANCVGKVGTAYIRIPASPGTGGQVQVVAQSRMVTLAAISDHEIASGERVKVLEVIGHDLVRVERV